MQAILNTFLCYIHIIFFYETLKLNNFVAYHLPNIKILTQKVFT